MAVGNTSLLVSLAVTAGLVTSAVFLPVRAASQATGTTTWLSAPEAGLPAALAPGTSAEPTVSADGNVVAFTATGATQVARSGRGRSDVFVHDSTRPGSQVEQVSVGSDEQPAVTGSSSQPSISCDGRFVAFTSEAAFDPDDRDGGAPDVYVRDRTTGTTELASGGVPRDPSGRTVAGTARAPWISADGRYVAMVVTEVAQTRVLASQVYVYDRVEQVAKLVSHPQGGLAGGDSDSFAPAVSADGGFVAFASNANLDGAPAPAGPRPTRVFVWQRSSDSVTAVSVSIGGGQPNGSCGPPAISQGGRLVAYACLADNLVPFDTNGTGDVFVTDWAARTTTLVSVTNGRGAANGDSCLPTAAGRCDARVAISSEGRFVAFASLASNLLDLPGQEGVLGTGQLQESAGQDRNGAADVFVRDLENRRTSRASLLSTGVEVTDGASTAPSISSGGRRVAFASTSRALTDNRCHPQSCPSNVFVRNDPQICFPCRAGECPPPPVVPSVAVRTTVVPEGRVAIALGSGFQPSATVEVLLDDRPVSATTDASGAFQAPLVIPHGFLVGTHPVTARSGTRSAKTSLLVVRETVQPPFPSFS